MRKWLAPITVAFGLTVTLAAPAAADPPSAAEFTLPVTCAGQTYEIGFIPGRGAFTPALVVDGTQVLVPVAIDLTFTDETTGESETETAQKGQATNPNAVTCTIDFTGTDPETGHEFTIEGTVLVVITPAR
jgi:hypothetical protein